MQKRFITPHRGRGWVGWGGGRGGRGYRSKEVVLMLFIFESVASLLYVYIQVDVSLRYMYIYAVSFKLGIQR